MNPELEQAIKERIDLGHTKEQITAELHSAGYDDATIEHVYGVVSGEGPQTYIPSMQLPSAVELFTGGWSFMTGRLDLVALFVLPTLIMNLAGVGMEAGWFMVGVPLAIVFVVGFVALLFFQVLLQLTAAHAAFTSVASEGNASVGTSFSWATKHVWSWLWIAVVSSAVVTGGLILFIIPGLVLSIYIMFSVYAFIDEDKRGMAALLRSRDLVYGNFWEIVWRFLLFLLIMFAIGIGIGLVFALIAAALGEGTTNLVLMSVVDSLLTGAASVIGVGFAAGLYRALKNRAQVPAPATSAFTFFSWLGAVVLVAVVGLMMVGAVVLFEELSANGFDFEALNESSFETQINQELSPEEQAEFDAFMEQYGEEFGSGSGEF